MIPGMGWVEVLKRFHIRCSRARPQETKRATAPSHTTLEMGQRLARLNLIDKTAKMGMEV